MVRSPRLDWIRTGVLGLPGRLGDVLLVPTVAGITEYSVSGGRPGRVLDVDRGSYHGRVDVAVVGSTVVEVRGDTVVGYAAS